MEAAMDHKVPKTIMGQERLKIPKVEGVTLEATNKPIKPWATG
jgi:hypothetical protein